jgi:hypothetical protein
LAIGLLLLASGCKERTQEYNGVGPYMLKKTTLADGQVNFRCQPSDPRITWCFGGPEVKLGDQPAAVTLYFAGSTPEAPLVEIALAVRACNPESAEKALVAALGPPTESAEKQLFWRKKAMFVSVKLRKEGTSCDVSFVDPADQGRLDELKSGK